MSTKRQMTPAIVKQAVLGGLRLSLAREGVWDAWLDEYSAGVGQDSQIADANERLARVFAQASARRAELKAVIASFREIMPAVCEALGREGIQAHFIDAELFGLVPTAVECELFPSMRFSWRNVHGDLIVGHVSGMDADDALASMIVTVAGADEDQVRHLLKLLAKGSLGYSPLGTKIADRLRTMSNE